MIGRSEIKRSFWIAAGLVGFLWAVYVADLWLPPDWNDWGIRPRSIRGLAGILISPILHDGFAHLLGNSPALLVLLLLLFLSDRKPWEALFGIILVGGAILWAIGRSTNGDGSAMVHVGASSVICGLISFLIAAGFLRKETRGILVAMVVLFFYGWSLFWQILPRFGSRISWEGHLAGAIAGIVVAWFSRDPSTLSSNGGHLIDQRAGLETPQRY
jgi:membrane associated rhomboid family serine protease